MSIKPALTPEEWAQEYCERRDEGADENGVFSDGSATKRYWTIMRGAGQVFIGGQGSDGVEHMTGIVPTADHALAALCLKGQPFGFTREHVKLLERFSEGEPGGGMFDMLMDGQDTELFTSLCSIIKALLPPEGET